VEAACVPLGDGTSRFQEDVGGPLAREPGGGEELRVEVSGRGVGEAAGVKSTTTAAILGGGGGGVGWCMGGGGGRRRIKGGGVVRIIRGGSCSG